ncbi:DNA cytosine methyltransferase [Burkholderia gladioli]|uniref:DNA cytosine methyltransferase n=1 Tax=Burkholderia gladioli TaxID=28095 RepID=UPI001C5E79A9|nr:DNA cytosine methyltransferase [Burkholderia gladioli]MBW5284473.1 DNA cytosine methyltransferase [Burkholderia gladioli]
MKNQPVVIDLFAGAGGLSLGASLAGFRVAAAVELDAHAVATHAFNFPNSIHANLDIASLTGQKLLEIASLKKGELDGLIGGPPCQGFSTIGQRNADDIRNDLFGHFFRLVSECRPRFFVAENVPGIMDSRYDEIRRKAFKKIAKHYCFYDPILVKASEYGAPTTRTRYFFIGYDRSRFLRPPSPIDFLPTSGVTATVVSRALASLPIEIDPRWQSEEDGWQKLSSGKRNAYVCSLAEQIPPGVGNSHAIDRLFSRSQVSGCLGTRHLPEVIARFEALQPGERDQISKSTRLDGAGFCPTLRAGTGKEKGSFQAVRPVHHLAPRVITPREAARLQGFPDWFVFHPTKWHSFRQIGNSVSPIVAKQILFPFASSEYDL